MSAPSIWTVFGFVKAVAALGSLPNYLITSNPKVKTLKDLSDKDRIAVPAAGVGFQSRTLQIETAKLFGPADFKRFDNISVSLPHPDATAALVKGGSEINTHFSSAPFYYQALAGNPAVHKVISSYDILGGPATFNARAKARRDVAAGGVFLLLSHGRSGSDANGQVEAALPARLSHARGPRGRQRWIAGRL